MVAAEKLGWVDRRCTDRDVGQHRRRGEIHRLDTKMTRTVADWLYRFRLWPWAITIPFLPALLWPSGWWLEVKDVVIRSAAQGTPLSMTVDRQIKRSFLGTWQVTIRQWDGAGWLTWCNASGRSNYNPEARYPRNLSLQWWTDGACHPLPAGRYRVTTTWTVQGNLLPDKHVVVDSNIFEVTP